MSNIEDVTRSKWIALAAFLVVNFLQIILVSLLTLDESTLWIIGMDPSLTNPLVSIVLFVTISLVQLVLIYMTSSSMLKGEDMIQLHPPLKKEEDLKCIYTRAELISWTLDLAKKSEVTVTKIFVIKSPFPNAFTFSLPFLGSIVVIHSNLLDLLSPQEVQAIIAHEIGHIKSRDSIISIFSRMPSYFVDIIYLYIYIRLGLGIANSLLVSFDAIAAGARILVLIGFFVLSRVVNWIGQVIVQKASRDAEFLSDHHAAQIVNFEAMINALIRLGQRVEAVSSLIEEIRWLESLNPERMNPINDKELKMMILSYPLDSIDERNARDKAPWVFLSTRLVNMRTIYGVDLSDDQILNAITPAVTNLLETRKKDKPDAEEKESPIVDWRNVDQDGDRRITDEEMQALIKLLRANPTKFMFRNEASKNILTMGHPDFRRRILFLADVFEK